jgi:DUF1680 family protein
LEAARRIGDLLCATFGDKSGQRDIIKAGEHVGMAATSVLEPMVKLYRATGEQRYLDFCRYITRAYEEVGGPKILSNLEKTGRVYGTANGKAYEMLSNLVGVAELYRATGEASLLPPVLKAWEDVAQHRLYISGTASSKEYFQDDGVLPAEEADHVGEGYVTVTWMQLSWQLLRLTGEAKYAEEIERTVYNQLLAAQNARTGDISYFTPLNGKREQGHEVNCCLSSEPRGIAMIPQMAWGTREGAVQVNLYVPGEMKASVGGDEVTIRSQTNFPREGKVVLSVDPAHEAKFALLLRVPAWCARYQAEVDGQKFEGQPGQWLCVERTWRAGDRVTIDMDMTVRVYDGGRSYPGHVAIQRGPQVLAMERSDNTEWPSLEAAGNLKVEVDPNNPQRFFLKGAKETLVLVPFADAQDCRAWMMTK